MFPFWGNNNPAAGSTYVVGTNLGPAMPFAGTTSAASIESLSLSFTSSNPMAGTVTVELELTQPGGAKCYEKVTVTEPYPCSWLAQKPAAGDSARVSKDPAVTTRMNNSMLIFPNPASNEVTVSYDYGALPYAAKGITVFNALGSKVVHKVVDNATGSWKLNVDDWSPGIYMIRMEGDGAALQTQRVVVVPQ